MRDQNLTCIGCPLGCSISVSLSDNGEVSEITGNTCKKGEESGENTTRGARNNKIKI